MTFNNDQNLSQAYDELKEGMAMTREEFEARLLTNQPEFAYYARAYMDDETDPTNGNKMLQGFLRWSWFRYQAENQPANKSWEQEAKPKTVGQVGPRPKEYNFSEPDWEKALKRRGM